MECFFGWIKKIWNVCVKGIELKHILRSNCAMAAAASATIFDFAYSIRIAPRSDDSRNVPWSADIAEPAHAASLNSTNATGTLPCCVPFECIRRRQKPGKLRAFRVNMCVCVNVCLYSCWCMIVFGWYLYMFLYIKIDECNGAMLV